MHALAGSDLRACVGTSSAARPIDVLAQPASAPLSTCRVEFDGRGRDAQRRDEGRDEGARAGAVGGCRVRAVCACGVCCVPAVCEGFGMASHTTQSSILKSPVAQVSLRRVLLSFAGRICTQLARRHRQRAIRKNRLGMSSTSVFEPALRCGTAERQQRI